MSLVGVQSRAYQDRAIESIFAGWERPLLTHPDGRTTGRGELLWAATGAGKTIIMARVGERLARERTTPPNVLVLQHREELVAQNKAKFCRVNRGWDVGEYSGDTKRFARPSGYDGAITFATAQSLSRPKALQRMPAFDVVIADEAHHAPADTWQVILGRAIQLNPAVRLLGLTATPERADGKSLGATFDRVADIIPIHELVEAGWLVRPVALDAQLEVDLRTAHKRGGEFDMSDVARMIDRPEIARVVIDRWRAAAGDRQTAFFAATKAHARHFCESLRAAGVQAGVVVDETPKDERRGLIATYARREIQALVNVGTLTEGWDDQQTSCVCLLRPTTSKSLLIQIIGRGLRCLDRDIYPDAPDKSDCLILDFGRSLAAFDGLSTLLDLNPSRRRPREPGVPPMKPCKKCHLAIPLVCRVCPLCGFEYPARADELPPDFDASRITLRPFELVLKASPFSWYTLPSARARIACSEDVWAIVFADLAGDWHAFGVAPREIETPAGDVRLDKRPRHLASGTLDEALSHADAFMDANGDARDWGTKSMRMRLPPTDKQLDFARRLKIDPDRADTLYTLNCRITAKLASDQIRELLPEVKARLPVRAQEAA